MAKKEVFAWSVYDLANTAFSALFVTFFFPLYIKQFMVDPKGKYLDHPWGIPSDYGDAIQIYNDDGNMGGFTELECHGPAHILAHGEKQSHDIYVHVLTGPVDELKEIGSQILELDFSQLTFF